MATNTATTTATVSATSPVEAPKVSTVVPSSGPGIRVKTLSNRQIDEVMFWVTQLKEHCLFLYLGLLPMTMIVESPLLAKTATAGLNTQAPPSLQLTSVENAKLIAKLKSRSKQLVKSWAAYEKMMANGVIDVPILTNLVNHTRYVKTRIIDLQQQNVWVGWLFPEFVVHIRDELDYFVNRFNDTISPDAERVFWTEINAEHLAFTAHLLDTDYNQSRSVVDSALKLSDEGLAAIGNVKKTPPIDLLQMAELSRRFDHLSYAYRTNTLSAGLWNGGTPTSGASIHPLLIAHVIREGQRSIQRLNQLGTPPPRAAGQAQMYQRLALSLCPSR
jgi:hypothetical protein